MNEMMMFGPGTVGAIGLLALFVGGLWGRADGEASRRRLQRKCDELTERLITERSGVHLVLPIRKAG